jgi:hypothetical protein
LGSASYVAVPTTGPPERRLKVQRRTKEKHSRYNNAVSRVAQCSAGTYFSFSVRI